MAAHLTTEAALKAIRALAQSPPETDLANALRPLLAHKSNHVVSKAAKLVEDRRIECAAPELIAAFPNFMSDPVKRDPGCSAKMAIVSALVAFGERAWDVYLAGVRHVQKEPSFGPPIDTAATLRANCGRCLMALGHPDAFRWHALLIADPEPMTRALAVETLGDVDDERAELLLRTKIAREPDLRLPIDREPAARDPERGVEMDAFAALMRCAPETSFDFVASYLHDDDLERMRGAAIALGASHSPEAFGVLRARWEAPSRDEGLRGALALPIALVRSEEAFAFLEEMLPGAPTPLAEAIIEALALYRESPDRVERVRHAVDRRKDRKSAQIFRKHFELETS